MRFVSRLFFLAVLAQLLISIPNAAAAPSVLNGNLQIRLVLNTTNSTGSPSIRIAKDPTDNRLYYLKYNGDIFRVNLAPGAGSTSTLLYTAADHGLSDSVQGLAIGPDGTIYVVANTTTNQDNSTFARVMKGVPNGQGGRVWSMLVQTEPYPRSRTAFDHVFNGIVVSPGGDFIYLNSGSRTDHGEEESTGGIYPNLREAALTAKILRVPAASSNLILPNDLNALRNGGYIFAEGTRNAFDLAFEPGGDLFATDNGPDRDMSDELNWLRPGLHYGFPWRMGGTDNPQQFPNYDPSTDRLLDPRFVAVFYGTYHNDPTFPPPPSGFAEPVINLGPDANSYRDPADGSVKTASQPGQTLSTFTAHRSPLGLVFDNSGAMAPPFQRHGFVLGWTQGDPNGDSVPGPFMDPGQDMLDLDLTRLGDTNYQAGVTRLAGGFSFPIDAEILSNKVYIIEYNGSQGIWEITFPAAVPPITLSAPQWLGQSGFAFSFNSTPGQSYAVDVSTNLTSWTLLTNVSATSTQFQFIDHLATNYPTRFYRVH